MANRLEEARMIINDVDSQMAKLFVKRMKAAEIVFEYKKEFGLPVFDGKREEFFPEIAKALKSCLKPGDNVEIAKADFKLLKAAEKLAKPVYKKP